MKRFINNLMRKVGYRLSKARSPHAKESYSQCGEDLIVQYVFILKGIRHPSYLDIGANDPFFLNNTTIFYNRGCRGINIDANPQLIEKFKVHRPGDQNLNMGIGPREDELDFYIFKDHTLSTFSKEEADKVTTKENFVEQVIKVKLTTIDKILATYFNGKFPDFLSLDVEGLDFEILKSLDFEKYWPKVICVEAAEYSPRGDGARKNDLINFIISKGYIEYANTNLNAILVKEEFWRS